MSLRSPFGCGAWRVAPAIAVAVCAQTALAGPGRPAASPRPGSMHPASPAEAAPRRRMVGILDVRVDGVPDEIKAQFERDLEHQLDGKTYWLSSRAQMRERMKFSTKWTEGCLVGACLTEVKTQTAADLVLLAAFNGSGTSFGHVVTLVRTDTGRVVAQETGRCDVCTVKEAMAEATLATIRLLDAVPEVLPAPGEPQASPSDAPAGAPARAAETGGDQLRRRGITLAVLGLAAVAGGVAAYYVRDEPDWAIGVAAAGGGLTLGGLVVLAF